MKVKVRGVRKPGYVQRSIDKQRVVGRVEKWLEHRIKPFTTDEVIKKTGLRNRSDGWSIPRLLDSILPSFGYVYECYHGVSVWVKRPEIGRIGRLG